MKLTVIGSGDAFGSGGRFNTCFRIETSGRDLLLDCGASSLPALKAQGVDPNTISAGLAVREEDVLRALHALPDNAGPAAFLTQLRLVTSHTTSPAPPPE